MIIDNLCNNKPALSTGISKEGKKYCIISLNHDAHDRVGSFVCCDKIGDRVYCIILLQM